MMVGGEVASVMRDDAVTAGDVLLEVRNLTLRSRTPFAMELKNLSLSVRAGEVLAIAGVAGNGQGELFDALSGEYTTDDNDAVRIRGRAVRTDGINNGRRLLGAGFVPEERNGHGAVGALSLSDNLLLARNKSDAPVLPVRRVDETNPPRGGEGATQRICEAMDVRKSGVDPAAQARFRAATCSDSSSGANSTASQPC